MKWTSSILKTSAKDLVKRMRKQAIEREKIFINHILNKGLVSRKNIKNRENSTVKNNSGRKWEKDMKRHSTEEDMLVTNKYMKRCSALLAIRKMQTKITMRYYYPCNRMHPPTTTTKNDNTKC